MTVQELIDSLKTLDPNLTVLIMPSSCFYHNPLQDHQVTTLNLHEDYEPSDTTRKPESKLKTYAIIG